MTTMPSEWQVSVNPIGIGQYVYQVYRRLNKCAVDHSGDREYRAEIFDSEKDAQALADKLNKEESEDERT